MLNSSNKNNNGNNKDLSSLQISLSNLLSDVDSRDTIINHNKMRGIFNNHINKLENEKYNCFIDISNENPNLSLSNNNTNNNNVNNTNNTNNTNNANNIINVKNKIIHNEEQSSAFSVCNYSRSSLSNNNQMNNNMNKYNISIKSIGNNYIINSSDEKNVLPFNREQNYKIKETIRNKKVNKNEVNQFKFKNNYVQISPYKPEYQIEKGENIQLSILNNISKPKNIFNTENKIDKYNNNLSINKEFYFTINNSTLDNNIYFDIVKKNNTASIEIIKEENIPIKQNGLNKNKIKLINNKNIDIQKDESKKFFYNPKINNHLIKVNYLNKENNLIKNHTNKIRYYLNHNNHNNKTESSHNKDKKSQPNNFTNNINSEIKKNTNYFNINKNKTINTNNLSYHHKNAKSSQSYGKNAVKKDEIKRCSKKLFYIKKNRKTISISSHNSNNNSCNKKDLLIKVKSNTRNLETNEISSKYNNSVASYNKKNNDSKSKSKSKSKQKNKKMMKNECITEPTKHNNKKYFYESHKNTNLITNTLLNQIKSAQKKTTNKLLNKLNTMNNINININKKSLFPTFSKAFEKSWKIVM